MIQALHDRHGQRLGTPIDERLVDQAGRS